MKPNKWLPVFSFMLIPLLFGVVFIDLAAIFSFSDLPFLFSVILYVLFFVIQRSSSRAPLFVSLYFLAVMGLSYITTGTGRTTERLGEWFYIFFLIGLGQYIKESWHHS